MHLNETSRNSQLSFVVLCGIFNDAILKHRDNGRVIVKYSKIAHHARNLYAFNVIVKFHFLG